MPSPTGSRDRRVLFLAWAPFFSGAERALVLTARHLDPARYVPHVVLGTDGDTAAAIREAQIPCEVQHLAYLDRRHPISWVKSIAGLMRIARQVRPALIHANDVPSFQAGGYVARWLGIPAVTHVRFPDNDAGFSWFLRPGFSQALFVSKYLRDDAFAASPTLFSDRSSVLYDGVVLPAPIGDPERLSLRRELGLPDASPVVALTGQVSEVKGIWDFIEAARLLVARETTATFAVLGDDLKGRGALREAMERRVADLGIAPHFRFLGFRSDAPRLIPAFDIVTVPSHVEPLGYATLEAMAASRPVVGCRVGGIPEMVVDGETGLLVPPRNPGALAEAVEALLVAPDLAHAYGRAARARAEAHFSLPLHAERLQRTYDSLLNSSGSGRVAAHSGAR